MALTHRRVKKRRVARCERASLHGFFIMAQSTRSFYPERRSLIEPTCRECAICRPSSLPCSGFWNRATPFGRLIDYFPTCSACCGIARSDIEAELHKSLLRVRSTPPFVTIHRTSELDGGFLMSGIVYVTETSGWLTEIPLMKDARNDVT